MTSQASTQFPNDPNSRDAEIDQVYFTNTGIVTTESKPFAAQTYQAGNQKLESIAKTGSQSLPTNVIIRPKVIDKIEHKHNSTQRSDNIVLTGGDCLYRE